MSAPLWVWVGGLALLAIGTWWLMRQIQRTVFRIIGRLVLLLFFVAGLSATYWLLQG